MLSPPSLVVTEDKNQCLRAEVQQRVILAAMRWVEADSAIDEHEALGKLLKGRTGHAPGVSSNVGSYEYLRVSLPVSDVDAPMCCLRREKKRTRGVPVTDAATTRGSRCNSKNHRRTWLPRRSAHATQCAILCSSCPSNDEDRAHCPHLRPFREEKRDLRLIVDCRKANALFAPPPPVELLY